MSLGRPAGEKVCDDCRRWYPGPAFATYKEVDCPLVNKGVAGLATARADWETRVAHDCTQNVCGDCAGWRGVRPDKEGDPRA